MVSVLIKSGDYIILFAKTHHLKTLYIMSEGMEVNYTDRRCNADTLEMILHTPWFDKAFVISG